LVAAEAMVVPNGIALSADGRTMVVAETFAARLTRFSVESDGTLTDRQVFAEIVPVTGRRRAGPDGICLDEAGAAWVAEWIGRRVLRVEPGGAVTHEIVFDVHPLAVALGGVDRRQLFVCLCAQIGKRNRKPEPLGAIAVVSVDVPGAGEP
jgi:sugar lactone lactonase YvrE